MENYIGSIYSALAEAGIDTSNMTFEEVLEKYNEIAEDVITIEEATEEVMQEVEEAQEIANDMEEEVTPELMEEVTNEEKAYPEGTPTQEESQEEMTEQPGNDADISDEDYNRIVAEYKEQIKKILSMLDLV